jgi:hypothetical protein
MSQGKLLVGWVLRFMSDGAQLVPLVWTILYGLPKLEENALHIEGWCIEEQQLQLVIDWNEVRPSCEYHRVEISY